MADRITQRLRQTDEFARWGGDEFLLVLADTGLDGAERVAWDLHACLQEERVPLPFGQSTAVSMSMGVAIWRTSDGQDYVPLVTRADTASTARSAATTAWLWTERKCPCGRAAAGSPGWPSGSPYGSDVPARP